MQQPMLPTDVSHILHTLNTHGFEAYIVGGCVRDCILGRVPQDWDITTSAEPLQVKALFPQTFDTGIQHGTITVVENHVNYEITTYRVDGAYTDSRHPEEVFFTKSLTEDLRRRDFTMNAIAYHPDTGFQDPFQGILDIHERIIRGVGNPALRFQEDALRMLRCVRFSAQLGFQIEPQTNTALTENAPLIQNISVERIKAELDKLWASPNVPAMAHLWESGLVAEIDPLLSKRLLSSAPHLLHQLAQSPQDLLLRWCLVLQDYTGSEAKALLKKLKSDTAGMRQIILLLGEMQTDLPTEPYPLRRAAGRLGIETLHQLLTLQAILRPLSPHLLSKQTLEGILEAGDCFTLKTLALSGSDLLALGIPNGKELGGLLARLLD